MSNIAKLYPDGLSQMFNPARVINSLAKDGFITIDLQQACFPSPVFARLAIALGSPLREGDEVLIAGQDVDSFYVIGVLSQESHCSTQRHELAEGAYVLLDDTQESAALQVYSKQNELLIEYDPVAQKTKINIDKGNLEFTTQDGDIVLDSGKNIKLKGHNIDLTSTSNIQLSVGNAFGQLMSTLSMKASQLKLNSPQLNLLANKSNIHILKTHFIGEHIKANIKTTKLIVDKLHTVANSMTQKTKNLYSHVEELSQIKAGRMRTLVTSTFHLKAKKSTMKAEDDFKVNAKKIHLG